MLNFGNKEFRNLQEQVLENAKNIEILKERPQMRVVVVDELPAVGDPTVIYLVPSEEGEEPNVYEEYVWLEDEERYELIGTTGIDLSNMVTTDTEQTITGDKTFTGDTAVANLTSEGDIVTEGKVVIGATGYNIKKDSTNLVIEADGNPVKVRGDLLPNTGATYTLGNASDNRWKTLYLSHYVDWGNNAMIYKDSSNRVVISAAGNDRIKVGTVDSTYCVANWVPDADASNTPYTLGKDNMRWATVNTTKVQNAYSNLSLKGNPGITVELSSGASITPSTNNSYKIGSESSRFNTVFTTTISNGTDYVNVVDIVKKPNYSTPNVFASGTLDLNGEDTIDISAQGVGMPEDGLYMFTYGNCQCFIALTSTMIQNAASYPMRCPCPVLYSGSGYVGNLKITRAADVLTIKVAAAGIGNANGEYEWKLIKLI